jgi:hypothetical protein
MLVRAGLWSLWQAKWIQSMPSSIISLTLI